MENRTTADAVNGDTVDQISLSAAQMGAYRSSKEAQCERLYGGVSEPADIHTDAERLAHWQKCYRDLWQLKLSFEKEHNR